MRAPTSNTITHTLPPELFAQIKAIQIRTQRLVTDAMAGAYESAYKGRGMEFEQVREYHPGDDVRHIDWNVTARLGSPHVKEHREERELTVMLMVDVSSSAVFGSGQKLKNEVAAEVAAILAYSAIRSHDRVGLIIFSDRIERYIPPKKGRSHLWKVIREILTFAPTRRATDIALALDYLCKVMHRRVVAFVISDFIDERFDERLRVTARRHDVTAVVVTDPRERELPPVGIMAFEDAETGETLWLDTRDRRFTAQVAALARTQEANLRARLHAAGVDNIAIQTDASYVEPIVRFFRER